MTDIRGKGGKGHFRVDLEEKDVSNVTTRGSKDRQTRMRSATRGIG